MNRRNFLSAAVGLVGAALSPLGWWREGQNLPGISMDDPPMKWVNYTFTYGREIKEVEIEPYFECVVDREAMKNIPVKIDWWP